MNLYASTRGGRYHRAPSCGLTGATFRGLPDAWPPVTTTEARDRGLTPCRTCKPPPLLALIYGDVS